MLVYQSVVISSSTCLIVDNISNNGYQSMYSANLLAYVCTLKQIIFTVTFLHRRHLMYDIFSSIWLNSDGKFLGKYTIHIECLGTPLKTNISPEIDSTGR